ncbi:hypothetical protein IFM89_037540 [Coptis chinensis]|uniref:Phytocyanin domain-containing protein n=1 Tax=Coptis chinensis TaxID=261450 RepID=A0A835LWJ4_9MAGN|nr:hypothetical protein IFM89_037540 [Coptis chinensis]
MACDNRNMALLVFVVFLATLQVTVGVVHIVGDATGWTTIGGFNYTAWAASKSFHVGDTIVFNYNTAFHNVMQVGHLSFNSCNVTSPLATYTSGKDSIAIKKTGHYYYLCGVPGHCQSGQKVDIRVPTRASISPSPGGAGMSPSPSPMTSDSGAPGSTPTVIPKSNAPVPSKGLSALVALSLAGFAAFLAV